VPAGRTLSWLARQQNRDGGFSFATAGGGSDVDDTGAALEALGRRGSVTGGAVAFIRRQQSLDGGFPAQPGGQSNAQSTAFAIQGLLAAGVDPDSLHRHGAISPLGYLRSLIAADGHVRYSRSADHTPVWVTAQALMALQRRALPIAPVPRAAPASPHTAGGAAASASIPGGRSAGSSRAGAAAHAHSRGGRPGGAGPTSAASRSLARMAADVGLLSALAFAPVGLA
jgi:energy-coupling factor transport system substrate-specific component